MVLGVKNRTENWKTARYFQPFFGDRAVRISRVPGEPEVTKPEDVSLELYWKGVRDWCAGKNKSCCEEQLVESCRKLFQDRDLRQRIEHYNGFRPLRDGNYEISSGVHCKQLSDNLFNTEIDIVLESPGRRHCHVS